MTISDAEFRKRAHALLQLINERWRAAIAPVDLDECAECGKHGTYHKPGCDLAALLAAGEALSPNERAERRFGLYAGPCDCGAVGHVASCSAMKFPVGVPPLAEPRPRRTTHEWVQGDDLVRWPNCRVCGVIRRSDDGNGPCRGAPSIALRTAEPPRKEPF